MSTPTDSVFALFFSQPLVLWSFVLGVLILVTAVALNIIAQQRRKKAVAAQKELLLKAKSVKATEPLPDALATAVAALADLDDAQPEAGLVEAVEEEVGETAVNPLNAIADNAEEAEQVPVPEFTGVEVNSKLADLFQNDIIVDPHVQALRNSLDNIPMAELLAQLRDVAGQLKEHIPPVQKFEVAG